jgi:prolipoprotein diacylglyceryltransferase
MNWVAAIILSLMEVALALVFAMLFARLEGEGNMSLYGGLFFLPITYIIGALVTKRKVRDVVDVFAVCTLITVFFARLNCLIAGCCLGKCIGETAMRWPHREVELILYAILLEVFIYRCRKKKNHGELYPVYMISYGTLRFITEFLRESTQTSTFHRAHYWSIICVVIGVAALIIINHKYRKEV